MLRRLSHIRNWEAADDFSQLAREIRYSYFPSLLTTTPFKRSHPIAYSYCQAPKKTRVYGQRQLQQITCPLSLILGLRMR